MIVEVRTGQVRYALHDDGHVEVLVGPPPSPIGET